MRKKIFLFNTMIIIISIIILSIVWNKIAVNLNIENEKKNTIRELSLINNSLNLFIDTVNDYVINVTIDDRLQKALESYDYKKKPEGINVANNEIIDAATGVMGLSDKINGCSIVSPKKTIVNINGYIEKEIDELIKDQIKNCVYNKIEWSDPFKLHHLNGDTQNVFVVQKKIIDLETYNLLGHEYMYINERNIAKIYLDNNNNNSKFYIINKKNTIISSSQENSLNKQFADWQGISNEVFKQLISESNGVIKVNDISEYVTVQEVGNLDWILISTIPIKELNTNIKIFDTFIIILGLIYLTVGTIVAVLASYSISKPVNELVLTMEKINMGKREIRANTNTTNELKVLSTTFNSLMDKNEDLVEQLRQEQKAIRNYEFMLLQAQIKPHFLYNTLETISSFVKLNMHEEALHTVHCLGSFCRISLSNGRDIITIGEELTLIESYLSIQKYRNIKYLEYEINFDDAIMDNKIPKFTLQPIIENAIYHGMKPKRQKTILQINGRLEADDIIITIKDNGVGISDDRLKEIKKEFHNKLNRNHFGLHSVDSRIKLYYGDKYGINIESRYLEYTIVSIKLPNKRSSYDA